MKIKLELSEARYQSIKDQLLNLGLTIDDTADLILIERESFVDYLMVIEPATNELVRLNVNDIIFIESYGHNVEVHTQKETYKTSQRLYHLISVLNPQRFLRISNSVIISKNSVKKIKPTFSSKFILTLSNDKVVDVTRSYYTLFKEYFNL